MSDATIREKAPSHRGDKDDLIRRGEAEHRVYTKCAGKGEYTLAQACKDTVRSIPAVVSAATVKRRVWIVWNEAMTQGIVLTDRAQAERMVDGIAADDLTGAMAELHGAEKLTLDAVELELRT